MQAKPSLVIRCQMLGLLGELGVKEGLNNRGLVAWHPGGCWPQRIRRPLACPECSWLVLSPWPAGAAIYSLTEKEVEIDAKASQNLEEGALSGKQALWNNMVSSQNYGTFLGIQSASAQKVLLT